MTLPQVGKRDKGYFGGGIYFSADASVGHTWGTWGTWGTGGVLLISKVLVGKCHVMHGIRADGCGLRENFDSHANDDDLTQVVIFDPAQILPMYRLR